MVDDLDNFCLGVWRKMEEFGFEVRSSLEAREDAVCEVEGVSDAHQHQGGAGECWPFKDGVEHLLVLVVQLVHLIQHQEAANRNITF